LFSLIADAEALPYLESLKKNESVSYLVYGWMCPSDPAEDRPEDENGDEIADLVNGYVVFKGRKKESAVRELLGPRCELDVLYGNPMMAEMFCKATGDFVEVRNGASVGDADDDVESGSEGKPSSETGDGDAGENPREISLPLGEINN
jgi:hypothetical protein